MKFRITTYRQHDGTIWYGVDEVREHTWGKTFHPVTHNGKLVRLEDTEHFEYEDK